MKQVMPAGEQRLMLQGPIGQLEALWMPAPDTLIAPVTLVACHPHSLMGGTMNNKVVHTLARFARDQGFSALRFNFRGVGGSEGQYDAGIGESDDLLAMLCWVHQQRPADRIWLAGFSFGSYVSARTLAKARNQGLPIDRLLLLAPAVENYDFDALRCFPVPLTVLLGDQDEVVDVRAMVDWIESVETAKQYRVLQGAGHFFHGRLVELRELLQSLLIKAE